MNTKQTQSPPQKTVPSQTLTPGLTNAMLNNIDNLILEWSEASGLFLSIEPLMRFIAEQHPPFRDKVAELIKNAKKKPRFTNYWDCDPIYLTDAIKSVFGKDMRPEELEQISKFPSMRGGFLHGNFIGLMEVMGIEPTSRIQVGLSKKKKLEPGEIYESFLSMKNNEVFTSLCRYSSEIRNILQRTIRGLAK